ncbi:hypothetical protein D0Z07_6145 [Hyphodiscus hymeniophilus]|uniref:Cenp-O kinetochore centromere component n=1 Tax=Hyphodiscus hymeniophilus TaxID=353542 RepID=A0A9P7AUP0_9HELO|nr:hypothetical protein D0Z07_6145 [Hyphodiscus hymeniophilus]
MTDIESSTPEDPIEAQLDNEISDLQSQSKHPLPFLQTLLTTIVATLKTQRALQAATILSSRASKSILSHLKSRQPAPTQASQRSPEAEDGSPLISLATAQAAHNQENLYRACASITTFRIQDPDPNAVDGGNVLGIRIDVSSSGGKFARPYYVMLNKPWPGQDLLRVHRHTVPPCIPLASLAERHLPSPRIDDDIVKRKIQDLRAFVRALRREVVGYHNRSTVIKALRKTFKLDEDVKLKGRRKGKDRERVIADISAADAEAKQVRIEWVDGRVGRAIIGEKGEVLKCAVFGEDGRDYVNERRILGVHGEGTMDGIGERLLEGIY